MLDPRGMVHTCGLFLRAGEKPTARASDGPGTVQNERHSGWNA